jgi:predicted AlkP superfamily phosphohydrolase/phosphomutase
MAHQPHLAIVGFDSVSLPTLLRFVERGVMPAVARLIERGSTAQTWPCYPMETGTNWACLATGATPWVTGCNMRVHLPGTPLDLWQSGFPASVCRAEQLWTAAHRAGRRSVVFDWAQSWPLPFEDGIVHVGEDGRPDNAFRALQEVRAYTTHPRPEHHRVRAHVTRIDPRPADDWPGVPDGALAFDVPIQPGPMSRYSRVDGLHALIPRGRGGCDRVTLHERPGAEPLLTVDLDGGMSDWTLHTFSADGAPVRAVLRAKLLALSPDASRVHLYLSEIYPQDDFVHPVELASTLAGTCGPFVIQCSRQQVVQAGASDVATYFEEQEHLARWWRDAAAHLLATQQWDLFMLKWHGPDWTNHLSMYMIDPRHPMYEPDRAEEGWALWDRLMGWGDDIVAGIVDAAGPGTLIALVSDHGGDTDLPGVVQHPDPNPALEQHGWLVRDAQGAVDWHGTVAWGRQHYVFLNLAGREPDGRVSCGAEYERLRDDVMQALLAARDEAGRALWQAVMPVEDAGRLGVGGDRVGDLFLIPCRPHPTARVPADEFWGTRSREQTGTWDWPLLNAGAHSDDSYFVLAGPGVRAGYRRARPTLITSVAPTVAQAAGMPIPAHADGAVLRDFLT